MQLRKTIVKLESSTSMTRAPLQCCDVVIVNYNSGDLLLRCVDSALEAGVHRVIVVDNGSVDGSIATVERAIADSRMAIIRNGGNLGFAKACNIGVQTSEADIVLFLNPDCELTSGALNRLAEVLRSSATIGMVGGMLCNPDGSEQRGGRRNFPTPKQAFVRAFGLSFLTRFFPSAFPDFLLHKMPPPDAPVQVEAISGACMLVKRAAIDDVGLWDEDYFLHCEDLDWCMRFKLKGWQIFFVPDALVMHVGGACSRSRPIFVEWHKHRGMLRFYKKFFRSEYSGLMWLFVVMGVWFRFALISSWHTGRRLLARSEERRG
ncbi:MAG: glycosyltransferase family 2 protein [Porticoccaceae bacterium]|nr:glycosyltransferase family 2 protein [Porticoccaceae bacterium]